MSFKHGFLSPLLKGASSSSSLPAKQAKLSPPSPPAPACPSSPPPPPLPVSKLVVVWPDVPDGPSVFAALNIFRSHWFLHWDHLIANILSAQKVNCSHYTWVDFQPPFHTHLVQHMVVLLPPLCPVAKGKQVMFMFLLEILEGRTQAQFFS
jgi:hypothetical protein